MSQLTKENNGLFPNGEGQNRIKGKVSNPSATNFKSNKILSQLPGHEPLDSGGVKETGFQDLRNSTIRTGKI